MIEISSDDGCAQQSRTITNREEDAGAASSKDADDPFHTGKRIAGCFQALPTKKPDPSDLSWGFRNRLLVARVVTSERVKGQS